MFKWLCGKAKTPCMSREEIGNLLLVELEERERQTSLRKTIGLPEEDHFVKVSYAGNQWGPDTLNRFRIRGTHRHLVTLIRKDWGLECIEEIKDGFVTFIIYKYKER